MSEQNEEKKAKSPRVPKEGGGGKGRGRGAAAAASEEKAERSANLKPAGPSRLHAHYQNNVVGDLIKKFGYQSKNAGAAHQQDRAQHGRGRSGGR